MTKAVRDGFGEALAELGARNKDIVVVDADLKDSIRLSAFAEKFPERFIEVGVAEQNLAGVAAGLALSGKTVFLASYAAFSPAINWNTIRISICYSGANVKIVGAHAGLMTAEYGASHEGTEDIALMRVLPGMVILVPADFDRAKALTELAAGYKGPVYLRLARPETPLIKCGMQNVQCKIGGSEVLQEGQELTIVSCGPIITEVIKAISLIGQIGVELINCYSVKPLDKTTILRSAAKTGKVLTVEDHSVIGGLGGAVAELLAKEYPLPLKILGVPDVFGESARSWEELLGKYHLDSKGIAETIRRLLAKT